MKNIIQQIKKYNQKIERKLDPIMESAPIPRYEDDNATAIVKMIGRFFMPMTLKQHLSAIFYSVVFYSWLIYFYSTYTPLHLPAKPVIWALLPSFFLYKSFEYIFYRKIVLRGIVAKGWYAFFEFLFLIVIIIFFGFAIPLKWI